MFSTSFANTHHGVTTFEADGMVQNTNNSISREENITFILIKVILELGIKDYIFRSYHFLVEVTFKYASYGHVYLNMLPFVYTGTKSFQKFLKIEVSVQYFLESLKT